MPLTDKAIDTSRVLLWRKFLFYREKLIHEKLSMKRDRHWKHTCL